MPNDTLLIERLMTRGYELDHDETIPLAAFMRYLEHMRWMSGGRLRGRRRQGRGVVRAQRIEILHALGAHVDLEMTAWISRMGRTSMDMSHDIIRVEDEGLLALLYVDSLEPHFCDTHDLARLGKFSRIIAKAVNENETPGEPGGSGEAWEAYLERTPVEDMEREKLLLLLNRNEWNIARVARLMGVTRRTIYLRLQRYNIPRERVPKSRQRTSTSSS